MSAPQEPLSDTSWIASTPSSTNLQGLSLDDFPLSNDTSQGGEQEGPFNTYEDLSNYEDLEEGDLIIQDDDIGRSFSLLLDLLIQPISNLC